MAFRDDVIKLAHDNPGKIRDALLPVLASQKRAGIDLPGMDMRSIAKLRQAVDPVTYKLLREIYRALTGKFDANDEAAMNRVRRSVQEGASWSQEMHQNNLFKAADLLKIKLPHQMF